MARNTCTIDARNTWSAVYMNKTSEAKLAANKKYNDKATKIVAIRLQNDATVNKESLQEWAKSAGMSVNKYVITAIFEKHERDTQAESSEQE